MATTAIPDAVRDPIVEPAGGLTRSGTARLDTIDALRGLVIAIMVLDHVRDFFHEGALLFDPTDPARTTPLLFATRWITHLCATTFVFLSGVSIYLQRANGKPADALSKFLLSRGLWLIFLELTVVSFGFNFGGPFAFMQVIWAIGFGMVAMSVLARLGPQVVLAIGVAIIALSPLVAAAIFGSPGTTGTNAATITRALLFVPAILADGRLMAMYAAVPWLGVMCLGFGAGGIFLLPAGQRRRAVALSAGLLLALFAALRGLNGYGDPAPWTVLDTPARTVMSFLNLSKYPPSPIFVCATLGCSMLLFLALERLRGPVLRVLLDFGRTPLMTYVAHIYIAHGLMLATAASLGRPEVAIDVVHKSIAGAFPPDWGYSLPVVYAVWALVVAALVPVARWFADVKRRRRDWWLGYL